MLKKSLAFLIGIALIIVAMSATVMAAPEANGKLKVDWYDLGPEGEDTFNKIRALRDQNKLAELLNQDWVSFVKSGELTQFEGATSGHGLLYLEGDKFKDLVRANISGKNEPDAFAMVITGFLIPKESGKYKFRLMSDDSSRLKIGNDWVVSTWGQPEPDGRTWNQERFSDEIELEAGKVYPIRVEYFDGWGGEALTFTWSKDGGDFVPIPADVLASAVEGYEDPGSDKPSQTSDVSMLLPLLMAGAAALGALKFRKK